MWAYFHMCGSVCCLPSIFMSELCMCSCGVCEYVCACVCVRVCVCVHVCVLTDTLRNAHVRNCPFNGSTGRSGGTFETLLKYFNERFSHYKCVIKRKQESVRTHTHTHTHTHKHTHTRWKIKPAK